jgi:cytochrome c553
MTETGSSQPQEERFIKRDYAEGVRAIPRLGGLAYSYLKRRLEQWGAGYHAAAEPPMPRIASKLSRDEVEALASYLSFVK